jgi:tRNA (guanine-N7-)-methyltransferase
VSGPHPARLSPLLEGEALRTTGPAVLLGSASLVLEIGFGRGELLMGLAEAHPDRTFLGVEVSRKRAQKVARRIERRGLANCFVLHAPAQYALERLLPPGCVAECWICCPDPWPKKRHHKRRLIQTPFLELLARALAPGATLHVSTDDPGYADWMAEAFAKTRGLENQHAPEHFSRQTPARPATAYEAEWVALGREIAYFDYRREAAGLLSIAASAQPDSTAVPSAMKLVPG